MVWERSIAWRWWDLGCLGIDIGVHQKEGNDSFIRRDECYVYATIFDEKH